MKPTLAAVVALVSTTFATPIADDNYGRPSLKTYVAKYDDLPFNEPGANPIPAGYNGLDYTNFQVDQYDGWIPPTSGDKVAMSFGGSGNFSVPST